jgi:hypothetical protein
LGREKWIKAGIITLLLGLIFWPELYRLPWQWCNDSSWTHGFLIPFFSLYLLNQHKNEILNLKPDLTFSNRLVRGLGLFLLVFALIIYPLNVVHFRIGYARPVTLILAIFAVVAFMGGKRLVKYSWLPIVYLFFAIPLPDRYYKAVTMPLRLFAGYRNFRS